MSVIATDVVPDDAAWLETRMRKQEQDAGDDITVTVEGLPPTRVLAVDPFHTPFLIVQFFDRKKRHKESFFRTRYSVLDDGAVTWRIQWWKMPEKLGESIAEPIPEPEGESNAEAITQADAETAPGS